MADRVDPLYDQADAWSVKMERGITYRINLSPAKGAPRLASTRPGPVVRIQQACRLPRVRRLLHVHPGPDGGGTYSLLVSAPAGNAGDRRLPPPGRSGPARRPGAGYPADSDANVSGSLSGIGIDVIDLYRFDVSKLSTVQVDLTSSVGLQLALTTLDGTRIADTTPGSTLRKTLKQGTYLLAVSAPGRVGGKYTLALLVRLVTKTTLTADGKAKVTVPVGHPVVLQTEDDTGSRRRHRPSGARYQDPLAGWVFRNHGT